MKITLNGKFALLLIMRERLYAGIPYNYAEFATIVDEMEVCDDYGCPVILDI